MNHLIYPLISLFTELMKPKYDARLRFLEYQIQMLRSRIETDRIVPSPEERTELLRLGALFGHDTCDLVRVVVPETYRTWLRKSKGEKPYRRSGRSRIAQALRNFVLRIARENELWGYRRICGELKKLGVFIGDTTVRKILVDEGLQPPSQTYSKYPVQWQTFLAAHYESLVACDFFTKRIYTLRGTFTAYCLVFIHIESRRVYCSPATLHPNATWVMQQCRNASMWLEDEGLDAGVLIHDRDRKYPDFFKEFWASEDVACVKTPIQAPKANAFCESFIGTLKRECLNHFICFGIDQLDYINRT